MAKKRALIVDDSTTAQYRLKKMLKAYALDIDVADSGEAALRYLANNVPDVVFMDHTMPGMDGLRALQVIKSHPETAVIPVIMYTSQSGDVYTGQARALGALDVVSKDKINATDLSRVMQAIHIYPMDEQEKIDAAKQTKEKAQANSVSDIDAQQIERRSPTAAEQVRNLELRLSQLEHTLEDSRRFIVARVVRELQNLRQHLKQEFNSIPQYQPPPISPPIPDTKSNSGIFKFFSITLLLAIVFFLIQISVAVDKNADKQLILQNHLEELSNKDRQNISATTSLKSIADKTKNHYLNDLVWTFNQQSQLAFNQNTADIKPLMNLYALLNRVSASGFKGDALITISVGNFCNSIDNMGAAKLAKAETNINECIFSSELYTLDRIMNEYSHQANLILNNLIRDHKGNLNIIINTQEGTDPYPIRNPAMTAQQWNQVAEKNNRIDLILLPE